MRDTAYQPNSAAIVGMGTKIVTQDQERITSLQLQLHACREAMRDAGLTRDQIGGVFTCRAPMGYTALEWNMRVVQELKVMPSMTTECTTHGAGTLATMIYAAIAVRSGAIDFALCCSGCTGPRWTDIVKVNAGIEADMQFETPYGPTTPSLYAQWARRYMHEFDVTPEDLAPIAVENRKWAVAHPDSAMGRKGHITVADVLASPMLASPIRFLDSSTWFKGGFGTAVVITRAENADPAKKPVYISGFGQAATHEWLTERLSFSGLAGFETPNLTTTAARPASRDAYRMAGLGPKDMDLVETSVPFTFANMMVLEDLGFCEKGEGKHFVRGGGIDYDTGLPFNTNGGYLSFGQAPHGMHMAVEAIEQLRGEARGKQVKDPRHAMVHFHGGPLAAHSTVIFSNRA